jgi:2-oxoglutarate ferredoxin oxidoreductase subunit alpha
LPPEYKSELQKFLKENSVGETLKDMLDYAQQKKVQIFPVPYRGLLSKIGKTLNISQLSKITRMINVLTIGVSFALLKYDKGAVEKAIRSTFPEKIAPMNVTALGEAYDYAARTFRIA